MMVLHVVANAIVAGARAGAGALEVVWVRDVVERDLSKNATMAYNLWRKVNSNKDRKFLTSVSVIAL